MVLSHFPVFLFAAVLLICAAPRVVNGATTESLARQGMPLREQPVGRGWHEDQPVTKSLAKLLPSAPAELPSGFYTEIPVPLEPAVRAVLREDYGLAEALLARELEKAQSDRERARVFMWLGLAAGQRTLDSPREGSDTGSSATLYLMKAIRLDPRVFEAPDVARTLADMAAMNCGVRDFPEAPTVLEEAVEKAEGSKKPLDYFYAGIMARRSSMIAWLYTDTEQLDRLAYRMLSRAVEGEPTRYEFWTQYLPAMAPVQLHAHMTSESVGMYQHFKSLRHPLLVDQGPAALHLRTRQGYSMEEEDRMLEELAQQRPDEPFPPYQLALWAIETTPSLAIERFEKFIARLNAGQIRLEPREEGYHPSSLYKLAFLFEDNKGTTAALEMYEWVKEISPGYAETNGNIAGIYARMAADETTGPLKLRLMERSVEYAEAQAKFDYRGKARGKAQQLRRTLLRAMPAVKREMLKHDQ